MRKIIIVLLLVAFFSCNENRNQLMTKLINEKKTMGDSVKYYHGSELMFEDSARQIAHATHDSAKYLPLADSQSKYWGLAYNATKKIKAIDFSIDSLSKMK